jgi:hypothetical protein
VVENTHNRFRRLRRLALLALLCAAGAAPGPAAAQSLLAESETYPVSAFVFEYALEHPDLPDLRELEQLEVEVRSVPTGFVAPHPNAPTTSFRLGAVPPGARFHPGALRQVNRVLVEALNRRGLGGVLVTLPDLEEESGRDLRRADETRLRVQIWTGRVEGVSTLADGERFADLDPEARTNLPQHAWIREDSPVQAGGPDALLRPPEIEDYAARLSRHAGRRVRPVLRPGALPGATRLEYHVAEQKPWLAYAQLSNTGTQATTRRRERFGFSHTQLSGNDDELRFDYVTGDFEDVHAVWGEYGGPLWRVPRMRWRVDGSWSQYDSSEVGVSELDFEGDQWHTGGRLSLNVFQHRELFVDLFAGARWLRVGVENSLTGDEADHFFLPGGGIAAQRVGEVWSFTLEGTAEHNVASIADTGEDVGPGETELTRLGRTDAEDDFTTLSWRGEAAVYPSPLLRRATWLSETELGAYDFAHELAFMTLGQTSFGDRLVPQLQQVAGGLYTVRGYKPSVAAGDTVAIASAEYRVHLPRLLWPSADAPSIPLLGSFRVRPEHAFAFPDWDLILRGFVDYAYLISHDRSLGETNETLHSLGVGAELRVLRHVSARLDLAWPQHRLDDNDPSLDKPEIHGVLTLLY